MEKAALELQLALVLLDQAAARSSQFTVQALEFLRNQFYFVASELPFSRPPSRPCRTLVDGVGRADGRRNDAPPAESPIATTRKTPAIAIRDAAILRYRSFRKAVQSCATSR